MDFFDVVNARHSIRAFQSVVVESEKLSTILDAANRAPSAVNIQSYEIYVAQTAAAVGAVAAATWNQDFVAQAPVALVFCAHPARSVQEFGEQGAGTFALEDATIACTFAMLAATAEGLTSCWVGAFDPEAVRRVIGAPEGVSPISILAIGYPAQEPELTTRRSLHDLVHNVK